MNIFCLLGLHKWIHSIEKDGYGKYVPVGTNENPSIRVCDKCCRKEYIVVRNKKKRYLRRDPSTSDIREFKLNQIINKKNLLW